MDSENNNGIASQNVNEQGKEEDQEATALQRTFRSQGWNVAGANLLALSCWQAKSVYMYFRPIMEASDVALAAILAIVGAITSKGLGAMAGVAAGAAYLLWKAGSWKPAEEIIQRGLDRKQQSELVVALVDLCQRNSLDPEDLDAMVATLRDNGTKTFAQFQASLVNFFKVKLKMQE